MFFTETVKNIAIPFTVGQGMDDWIACIANSEGEAKEVALQHYLAYRPGPEWSINITKVELTNWEVIKDD